MTRKANGGPSPAKIIGMRIMSATRVTMLPVRLALPKLLYEASLLLMGMEHMVFLNNYTS